MLIGRSTVGITPRPGLELGGFAIRPQPSARVLDSLAVRCVVLQQEDSDTVAIVHADLLALDSATSDRLRAAVQREHGIARERVLISTTHTHSAPAVMCMNQCGAVNAAYLRRVEEAVLKAVDTALSDLVPCTAESSEAELSLAVNRRKQPAAEQAQQVGVIAWRCSETAEYVAVCVTYAMHPVCLRSDAVSGDWPGYVARALEAELPGAPVCLVSSGACGDLDPPAVDVAVEQMQIWAGLILAAVREALGSADRLPGTRFSWGSTTVAVPIAHLDAKAIHDHADACLAAREGRASFGAAFASAVEAWRCRMVKDYAGPGQRQVSINLFLLSCGGAAILALNGEVFSAFSRGIASAVSTPVFVWGCSNGMCGYLGGRDEHRRSSYEIDWAPFFYGLPMLAPGAFEAAVESARNLLATVIVSAGSASDPTEIGRNATGKPLGVSMGRTERRAIR